VTKTSNLNLITKKICELFEYTIPGEWGIEGDPENDIPVLRSTNFTNEGRIDYSNLAFRKIDPKRLALRLVNKGTILIEKSGGSPSQPAGRVVYCDEDFNGSASNFIEIAKTNNLFCPKYVFFLLHHLYQIGLVLKYQQQTTGIINFKLEQYKNEEVLLPRDRKEQTQIAAILSTIDRAIEQTEAIIAKQQRIKAGLMQDLLTKGIDEDGNVRSEATHAFKDSPLGRIPMDWEVLSLVKCAHRIVVGLASSTTHAYRDIGIPMIRNQNIRKGYFDDRDILYLEPNFVAAFPNKATQERDVITVRTGANVGDTVTVPKKYVGSPTFTTLITSTKKDILLPEYLVWYVASQLGQSELNRILVGGGKENLNVGQFINFRVALPPIEEQKLIMEHLEGIQTRLADEEIILAKRNQVKAGLMQDLLTGNVRVTALLNDQETAEA